MNLAQVLILLTEYNESERHLKDILKKLEGIEDRFTSFIKNFADMFPIFISKEDFHNLCR